jgi:hypothetical protein
MSQLMKAGWDFLGFLVTPCVLGRLYLGKPGGHLLEEVLLDAQNLWLLAKMLLLLLSSDCWWSPLVLNPQTSNLIHSLNPILKKQQVDEQQFVHLFPVPGQRVVEAQDS